MTDLVLAIAHHLSVFTLAGLLLAEIALLRPDLSPQRIRQLGAIDSAYGAVAVLIIVVGVLRVIFGDKGADYYLHNSAFLIKMSLFALVFALELKPMITLIKWRSKLANKETIDLSVAPSLARLSYIELILLIPIVFMAAAMARGVLY